MKNKTVPLQLGRVVIVNGPKQTEFLFLISRLHYLKVQVGYRKLRDMYKCEWCSQASVNVACQTHKISEWTCFHSQWRASNLSTKIANTKHCTKLVDKQWLKRLNHDFYLKNGEFIFAFLSSGLVKKRATTEVIKTAVVLKLTARWAKRQCVVGVSTTWMGWIFEDSVTNIGTGLKMHTYYSQDKTTWWWTTYFLKNM